MKREKGKEERKRRLIPEGELKCVWMEAGIVLYKLCDYKYECEKCPFDQVLRKPTDNSVAPARSPGEESHSQRKSIKKDPGKDVPTGPEAVDFDRVFQRFHGIRVKGDLFYHRGHTWVDVEGPQSVKVGIDDFASRLLLGIKMVVLPSPRNGIDRGQACCWIIEQDGTLPITAPLTGSVVTVNSQISKEPHLITTSPYEQGWLMRIHPENLQRDLKYLYREDDVFPRYRRDIAKVRDTFESLLRGKEKLGPTLCDGGNMLIHVRDMVGPKRYFDIVSRFFSGK